MRLITRFRKAANNNVSYVGLIVAVSAFGASLTPTMMPRELLVSGIIGGVVAALGYEVGNFGKWLWRYLELPELQNRFRTIARALALLLCAGIVIYSLSKSSDWQNATRSAIGLEPMKSSGPLEIFAISAVVAILLWALFRLLGLARRSLQRWLDKVIPRRIGYTVSTVIVFWLFWALVDGALVRNAFRAADASFEATDKLIEPDIMQPQDPMKAGSPESLIDWEEMGRRGRQFVANTPTAAEIAGFFGDGSQEPVRVYVGRRGAESPKARAELALEELIRVGGFERSVLVVVVPTGTGWMDPGAHDTLDFMFGGDVATVAVQYSYLSSFLALLAHPDYGVEQSRALFDTVYDYWTELPKNNRPRLYIHGVSQGAFNSQATLQLYDMLGDPIQGAMWAGSPFFSRFWSAIRDDRNPDSPAWRPTFGNGSLARVMNQWGGLEDTKAPWGPVRTVFLNYASDPIVAFTYDSAVKPPAWMAPPRAPDVSDQLTWFPVVTMLQIAIDSVLALQVPGYGHHYIARDYIDAWAAVTDPPDWSPARADELKAIFERRGPPD